MNILKNRYKKNEGVKTDKKKKEKMLNHVGMLIKTHNISFVRECVCMLVYCVIGCYGTSAVVTALLTIVKKINDD